jgi:hypothetical protein
MSCPYCDHTTYLKEHLNRHIKAVHNKVKENKCPHCDYTSCIKGCLTRHIKAAQVAPEGDGEAHAVAETHGGKVSFLIVGKRCCGLAIASTSASAAASELRGAASRADSIRGSDANL